MSDERSDASAGPQPGAAATGTGDGKPTIRVFQHLARTGGTLISKCLATMDGVLMLSEVHPHGVGHINPLAQAIQWFGLVDQQEALAWRERSRTEPMSFVDLIWELHTRAEARGKHLLLREWSHLDYHGVPFATPTYRSVMCDMLAERFEVLTTASVRHPVDQWLSLRQLAVIQGKLGVDAYLKGCERFAVECQRLGFVRYEDFTHNPDAHLRTLCERLALEFDPGYRERWPNYRFITGDTQGTRGGLSEIRPLTRRAAPAHIIEPFNRNPSFARTLELLGYPASDESAPDESAPG
jgi:hypothetical protein